MFTKRDCVLLLTELQENGLNVKEQLNKVLRSDTVPLDVLKYINDNRELELTNFYRKIRKSYNDKKSKLYINIMKGVEEPKTVLTTLSGMLTQILLHSEKLENKNMFLKHARADEISYVLYNYVKSYDISKCLSLLTLIRSDIKAIEEIYR